MIEKNEINTSNPIKLTECYNASADILQTSTMYYEIKLKQAKCIIAKLWKAKQRTLKHFIRIRDELKTITVRHNG